MEFNQRLTENEGMSPQLQPESREWRSVTRVAFRFGVIYFALYCLTNQVLTGLFPIPGLEVEDQSSLAPIRSVVFWAGAHVFDLKTPLVYHGSGSGDKTFDWVLDFCILVAAASGAAFWTVFDRRRMSYAALHKWFVVFLRFAVGSQLLIYGMVKFFPLQMPYPSLTKLVEPFGNFSPMGVLWSSIGASPWYERFVGSAEMFGAILLFFPRTALFGALVCLADATEVFMLNMTYDVPVKLFSFHLILMCLVLLAPELSRIVRFFFTDQAVDPSRRTPLFATRRANRIAVSVQVAYAVILIGMNGYGAWVGWHTYGGGMTAKSPLYGIWNVERPDFYRRVVFDRPGSAFFQGNDDTVQGYSAKVDMSAGTVNLSGRLGNGELRFVRNGADQMAIDGTVGVHEVHIRLTRVDPAKLPLSSRGFHWVQDFPFNR